MTERPPLEKLLKIVQQRRFSPADRTEMSQNVYRHMLTNSRLLRQGNFTDISNSDLGTLFHITDEYAFDGEVARLCERQSSRPLSFRLSTRMTTSGGMTTMQHSNDRRRTNLEFEIAIATTPLFATFNEDATAIVSGIRCRDRLEALQRIMEHEMVHLIEMMLWNDSNCSASTFKSIVNRFFGHTESNHQLLTPGNLANKRMGITVGDQVVFMLAGQHLRGSVNRITKRATILVEHPQGKLYTDGRNYHKFYVPIHRLNRV